MTRGESVKGAEPQEGVSMESSDSREATPPTDANSHCHPGASSASSCPAETSKELPMGTGQREESDLSVTPQKAGNGIVVVQGNNKNLAREKLEVVRKWSITTYKCTRQAMAERMGRGSRTVDLDLEPRLELLYDDRQRYNHMTRLAQCLANQLKQFTATQKNLSDAFADLGIKSPSLHVEFGMNAEAQRFLSQSGETLSACINTFTANMDTLVNKTIEDTMINAKQYGVIRMEYDAYRVDLEELNLGPRDTTTLPRLEQAQQDFQVQRERYQKVRGDLSTKLKLLQENKVKVLHKEMWLLHNAVASHCALCHSFLQQNMQRVKECPVHPGDGASSWLEDS